MNLSRRTRGLLIDRIGFKTLLAATLATLFLGLSTARRANAELTADSYFGPSGPKIVGIESAPATIDLHNRFEYRQLVIMGKLESGGQVDVSRLVTLEKPLDFVDVSVNRMVRPKADGKGELRFSYAGQSVTVPVTVSGFAADYPVSFVRDVMPTLSKVGCNAGTCHGSAQGKNGFKLSLRGYDPFADHLALTDDLAARRLNRASPEQSLMLMKPSGAVPHVGGMLIKPGQPHYELLKAWITQGAPLDRASPRVAKVEISPPNPTIPLPRMKQQFRVTATYTDGTQRDVTAEAYVDSGNIETLEADKTGLVTALRRGEAAVLVRFEGNYVATTVTIMGDRSGFVWKRRRSKTTSTSSSMRS